MGKSIFTLLGSKHFTSIWKVEYRNWSARFSQYPFLHDENDTSMVSLAGYYCWILSFDVSDGVVSQMQKLGCLHQSYYYVGWHSHTPSNLFLIYLRKEKISIGLSSFCCISLRTWLHFEHDLHRILSARQIYSHCHRLSLSYFSLWSPEYDVSKYLCCFFTACQEFMFLISAFLLTVRSFRSFKSSYFSNPRLTWSGVVNQICFPHMKNASLPS